MKTRQHVLTENSRSLREVITSKLDSLGLSDVTEVQVEPQDVGSISIDWKAETYWEGGSSTPSERLNVGELLDMEKLPAKPEIAFAIAVLGENGEDISDTRPATVEDLRDLGVSREQLDEAYRRAILVIEEVA